MATRTGIALGSNLGNRLTQIQAARDLLFKLADEATSCLQAPIYQSDPVNCPAESADFLNTVIEISYAGSPHQLLAQTQGIEFHMGRDVIHQPNAPRVIDIDILYFGDQVINESILTIPHPRLTSRRFVLQPLADIRPHMTLHADSATIAQHLKHLDSPEPPLSLVQSFW